MPDAISFSGFRNLHISNEQTDALSPSKQNAEDDLKAKKIL